MRWLVLAMSMIFICGFTAPTHYTQVKIAGATIHAQLATTQAEQQHGLQGTKLAVNAGMLFVYPSPQNVRFWMHKMQISIDIIWIGQNKKIISFVERAPICSQHSCRTYAPKAPVTYVLEVPAGFVAQHHLKPGMVVNF